MTRRGETIPELLETSTTWVFFVPYACGYDELLSGWLVVATGRGPQAFSTWQSSWATSNFVAKQGRN